METIKKFAPVALGGLCLLFTIIGCAIPQITGLDGQFKMYLVKTEVGDATINVSDYACDALKSAWQGAAAFAVLSVLISFVVLVVAVLGLLGKFSKKILNIVLWGLLVATSLIAWAIIAHNYNGTFCGACYADVDGFKLAGGIALFILTTLLAVVGVIVSILSGEGGDSSPSYQSV